MTKLHDPIAANYWYHHRWKRVFLSPSKIGTRVETRKMTLVLCFLLYLLIGAIVSLCMIITLGREQGDEVEIGLVTLFWPIAIVLDSLVSIFGKVVRFLRRVGRQVQKWSEPLVERLRNRNA